MKKCILSLSFSLFVFIGSTLAFNDFTCVPMTTSCGESAVACGFDTDDIIDSVIFWENFHCGDASVDPG